MITGLMMAPPKLQGMHVTAEFRRKEIVYMSADTLNLMNSGDLVTDFVQSQSHSIEVQEQPMQKKKKIV
jgi:hypothetical protein